MENSSQDIWAQWLLERRFGGDPERMKKMFEFLYPVRDKVLSQIHLKENETLLDVGAGDGLIAFGALEKFPGCHVIFSDISQDLLDHAEALAQEMNPAHRCRFAVAYLWAARGLRCGLVDSSPGRPRRRCASGFPPGTQRPRHAPAPLGGRDFSSGGERQGAGSDA